MIKRSGCPAIRSYQSSEIGLYNCPTALAAVDLCAAMQGTSWLSMLAVMGFAAMTILVAHAWSLRGDQTLRRWYLVFALGLTPISAALAFGPLLSSEHAATTLYRIGAALIPIGTIGGIRFQLALLPDRDRYKQRGAIAVALCIALALWIATSTEIIAGVQPLSFGWFPRPGKHATLLPPAIVFVTLLGFSPLVAAASGVRQSPSHEPQLADQHLAIRRQVRRTLLATLLTVSALSDVRISYGYGEFPLAWGLVPTGCALALRALTGEDLLLARTSDNRTVQTYTRLVCTAVLAWVFLTMTESDQTRPFWADAVLIVAAYCSVRTAFAAIALVTRGPRKRARPLDRLHQQFESRVFDLQTPIEITQLTSQVVSLGLGPTCEVWRASQTDWGWFDQNGTAIKEAELPDPMLLSWLLEHGHTSLASTTEVPSLLRDSVAKAIMSSARWQFLLRGQDLYGAIRLNPSRTLSEHESTFVAKVAATSAEALMTATLRMQVTAQVANERDIALASALQKALLPNRPHHSVDDAVAVVGWWQPASTCGGDFWTTKTLGAKHLIVVGDVAGHGVGPALVTAAVAGACSFLAEQHGDTLSLTELMETLHGIVRRASGEALHMTCFAAIVAPGALEYINAGHQAPYAILHGDGNKLTALVGRGNPLGMAEVARWKPTRKEFAGRVTVVAFTDGLTDTVGAVGSPYGERRLQKLVRTFAASSKVADWSEQIVADVNAHRGSMPLVDDQMLVIARF